MPVFFNWRFNPFTAVFHEAPIVDELHTIEFHTEWNAYGIQLHEAPQFNNPSTVEVIHNITGGATFTEIARTQAPNSGQYRVDYDEETYFATGRLEFNAADDGKPVRVSYDGLGTVVKNRYQLDQVTIIPTNLNVEGDINCTDNILADLDIVSQQKLEGASLKLINEITKISLDNTLSEDSDENLVVEKALKFNFDNIVNNLPFRNFEIITASGTWIRPIDVDFIFYMIWGGGGAGGGCPGTSLPGSGGSGSQLRYGLLAVTGNLAVTIGGGGIGVFGGIGNNGGNTILGPGIVTSVGGGGGNISYGAPGGPAVGGGGGFLISANEGHYGGANTSTSTGGDGGDSLGPGGPGGPSGLVDGSKAGQFGGGGGGSGSSANILTGSNGGPGGILIWS